MENEKSPFKLYTTKAIRIATLLGSPIIGGFLVRQNYVQLGDTKRGNQFLLHSTLGTILFMVFLNMILPPETTKSSSTIFIPILLALIMDHLAKKFQGEQLEKHKTSGGDFHSIWLAVGISLLFCIGILGVAVLSFIALDLFLPNGFPIGE